VAAASAGEVAAPTGTDVRRFTPANVAAIADVRIAAGGSGAAARIMVRHNETDTTAGGTATAGSWQTRTLNHKPFDSGSLATLTANELLIPAGTYDVTAVAMGYKVGGFKLRLWDVTNSTSYGNLVAVNGVSAAADTTGAFAHLSGRFTAAAPTTIRLEQRAQTTAATNGWGFPASLGEAEIYASLSLTKVA